MENASSPTFFQVFLAWLPFLILIGVLLYHARRVSSSAPPRQYWDDQLKNQRDTLEAVRETNRKLIELSAKLDK